MGIDTPYPIGELLICVGLVGVMIIENLAAEYEHVAHQVRAAQDEDDEGAALYDSRAEHDGHEGHSHVDHFTMVRCIWRRSVAICRLHMRN